MLIESIQDVAVHNVRRWIIFTFLSPSISASSCETTRSITPPESPLLPLRGANESSSSKKIMHGAAERACTNKDKNSRTIGIVKCKNVIGILRVLRYVYI